MRSEKACTLDEAQLGWRGYTGRERCHPLLAPWRTFECVSERAKLSINKHLWFMRSEDMTRNIRPNLVKALDYALDVGTPICGIVGQAAGTPRRSPMCP